MGKGKEMGYCILEMDLDMRGLGKTISQMDLGPIYMQTRNLTLVNIKMDIFMVMGEHNSTMVTSTEATSIKVAWKVWDSTLQKKNMNGSLPTSRITFYQKSLKKGN